LKVEDSLKAQSDMLKEEARVAAESGEETSLSLSKEEIEALEESGALIH